ncbi:Lsr2 family protein [Actinomadura sp. KC216]|uniref:histone-like nucleoid-structuring protein Lsr2 n=1 Tax=Actinomadura sp. KC216 TaxID=2530370 RepID=UPI001050C617|nr:Lsr2 family protein [Actinomadura sp. KC216]TDB90900.1 Lsr2 family protein [Actinomadura sp. KC216]
MATEIKTLLLDDIDGSEAKETITFSLDGESFEIDLNDKNAAKLRKALHPFMEKGRRQKATRRPAGTSKPDASRERNQEIRQWAKDKGIKVNERGRIPIHIVQRYEAANS